MRRPNKNDVGWLRRVCNRSSATLPVRLPRPVVDYLAANIGCAVDDPEIGKWVSRTVVGRLAQIASLEDHLSSLTPDDHAEIARERWRKWRESHVAKPRNHKLAEGSRRVKVCEEAYVRFMRWGNKFERTGEASAAIDAALSDPARLAVALSLAPMSGGGDRFVTLRTETVDAAAVVGRANGVSAGALISAALLCPQAENGG